MQYRAIGAIAKKFFVFAIVAWFSFGAVESAAAAYNPPSKEPPKRSTGTGTR